jgi:pimeloyl-ACP methyl ester carboxylesterase
MFFFQHPLSDLVVSADDMAFIDMIWRDWSPDYEGAVDAAAVKDALRDPEHLGAALGYYRAALSGIGVRDELADVQEATGAMPRQPLLYLHGADDGCIGSEVAESVRDGIGAQGTVEILPGVGHFLQLESPDLVSQRIVDFLS